MHVRARPAGHQVHSIPARKDTWGWANICHKLAKRPETLLLLRSSQAWMNAKLIPASTRWGHLCSHIPGLRATSSFGQGRVPITFYYFFAILLFSKFCPAFAFAFLAHCYWYVYVGSFFIVWYSQASLVGLSTSVIGLILYNFIYIRII